MTRCLRVLAESGLVAANDRVVSFVEPSDPLSRLFVSLALDATYADVHEGYTALLAAIPVPSAR